MLLALTMALGCAVNAFAYERPDVKEEEEVVPQRLTPVYMDGPPYETPGDYNMLESTSNYKVSFRNFLGQASTSVLLTGFIGQMSLPEGIFNSIINTIISNFSNNPNDPYATNNSLFCTERRYGSEHPDAKKIVRHYYYDSARTEYVGQAVYYVLYI